MDLALLKIKKGEWWGQLSDVLLLGLSCLHLYLSLQGHEGAVLHWLASNAQAESCRTPVLTLSCLCWPDTPFCCVDPLLHPSLSPAGPAFPSNENGNYDKLPDVLSATGRRLKSCMVDREFAISKHATGATSSHATAQQPTRPTVM